MRPDALMVNSPVHEFPVINVMVIGVRIVAADVCAWAGRTMLLTTGAIHLSGSALNPASAPTPAAIFLIALRRLWLFGAFKTPPVVFFMIPLRNVFID
ncbi:MAG: hypothetical protein D3924_17785 [Candidatus Electrothrix sp. AR4]|nr:hypothetical protein [Candidatus Electrothrix sp. AR4]